MIDRLIAEANECDFKVALETKKPKSWLKSVSAFANGIGGTLFFGISDGRKIIGLEDVQADAEAISRLIKEHTALPVSIKQNLHYHILCYEQAYLVHLCYETLSLSGLCLL